jgi:hypothetical protein
MRGESGIVRSGGVILNKNLTRDGSAASRTGKPTIIRPFPILHSRFPPT